MKLVVKRPFLKPVNVIIFYRPKKLPVNQYSEIRNLLASHCNDHTYITGDLNLDFTKPHSTECRTFKSMLSEYGFE